jgi:RNA 2',3'-cyclic 3'-phosphodiesterase
MHVVGKGNGLGQSDRLAAIAGKHRGIHQDATCVYPSGIYTGGGQNFCKNLQEHVASEPMFMICSWRQFTVLVMPEQLFLPGFERGSAIDFIFFALLLGAEHASRIVKLREYLCEENGLEGSRIAASLLHITLHGIGAYDGLPRAVVERAKQAGATISAKPFDVVFDRAMSFNRKSDGRPLVLCTDNEAALLAFHQLLGEAMKNVGFRRITSYFKPHMTLLYSDRMLTGRSIEPVRWSVRDFVLVHSLRGRGQSKYIHLARWPLRG